MSLEDADEIRGMVDDLLEGGKSNGFPQKLGTLVQRLVETAWADELDTSPEEKTPQKAPTFEPVLTPEGPRRNRRIKDDGDRRWYLFGDWEALKAGTPDRDVQGITPKTLDTAIQSPYIGQDDKDLIRSFYTAYPHALRPVDIIEAVKLPSQNVAYKLKRLEKGGYVIRRGRGEYVFNPDRFLGSGGNRSDLRAPPTEP